MGQLTGEGWDYRSHALDFSLGRSGTRSHALEFSLGRGGTRSRALEFHALVFSLIRGGIERIYLAIPTLLISTSLL